MTQPILAPLTNAAIFLVATVRPGGEPAVRDLLSDLPGLQRSLRFRSAHGEVSCVASIGSDAWERLFGAARPAELHPFREIAGDRYRAIATPGDLFFHVRANRQDLCFELASRITGQLADAVDVVDEVHGFRYFDRRDLLGFVDGTENPDRGEAEPAVLVGDADPAFAGGSYVIIQKYLHDLAAWQGLAVAEQERVIGRTKLEDIEMPDDVKPGDAHTALAKVTDPDGTEHKILRDNMPFGAVGRNEFGTYFVGYARSPAVTERMLYRMFVGDPPGRHDRILDFSTAVTGGLFFAPPLDFLEGFAT